MTLLSSSSGGLASRYLTNEYTLWNIAILATYILFRRAHIDEHVDVTVPSQLLMRSKATTGQSLVHSAPYSKMEAQVAATLVLTVIMRSYRATSTDAFLATLLGHCQLFVVINAALSDTVAAVWYLIAFSLVYLLFNEPSYQGKSKVDVLTAELFREVCLKDKGDGVAHVVFLETKWSSRCRHAYPMFAELSLRYATDKLRFARLDVGTWSRTGKALNLDLTSTSSQLPTVALFEHGSEVARVPAATRAALAGAAKHTLSKVQLISALELDARFARSMGSGTGTGTGTKS